jgi:hypothetical protein
MGPPGFLHRSTVLAKRGGCPWRQLPAAPASCHPPPSGVARRPLPPLFPCHHPSAAALCALPSPQKNNYFKSVPQTAAALEAFLAAATAGGAGSVLLVSGSARKRAFDALAALRHLAALRQGPSSGGVGAAAAAAVGASTAPPPTKRRRRGDGVAGAGSSVGGGGGMGAAGISGGGDSGGGGAGGAGSSSSDGGGGGGGQPQTNGGGRAAWPPIYVAFNPYLPDAPDREKEEQRLRDKLATGLVAGVYLQVGGEWGRGLEGGAVQGSAEQG